ncbi:choice-of-anchor R domain-containing protein [Cohnella sp. GCM10020058]|uniref:choice-of-anchor R domain-containing protein n=1 Tax=Cohnella sp. GCM10020058 TaxID=3317330 RepID=UPI003632D446
MSLTNCKTWATGGDFLNYGHSFGQTFTTPNTPDIAIDTVELFMDQNLPASGQKMTLKLYDSPSKTTLIGSSSITGPAGTIHPVFYFYKWLTPNTTYYMELTADGPSAQSYVIYHNSDAYSGGTAYTSHNQGARIKERKRRRPKRSAVFAPKLCVV